MGKRKPKIRFKNKHKFGVCDRCRKSKILKEFWFEGKGNAIRKWWCQDCLDHWMGLNVRLLRALNHIVDKNKITLFDKIKIRIKKILRIKG